MEHELKKYGLSDLKDLMKKASQEEASPVGSGRSGSERTSGADVTVNRPAEKHAGSSRHTRKTACDLDGDTIDRGREFKVGQHVVFMDSDLRGEIVSLGKTLRVKIDEDMVIDADPCEITVTFESEEKVLRELPAGSQVRKERADEASLVRKSRQVTSGHMTVDLHIDALPGGHGVPHGQELDFQMNVFRRVIRENLRHRGMRITVVHGVGDGVLCSLVRKELDEVFALSCIYTVGKPGVTEVVIR